MMSPREIHVQAHASVVVLTILSALVLVTGLGMLVAPGAELGVRGTGAAAAVIATAAIHRIRTSGVWAGDEGVLVRHFVSSQHFPWSMVKGFKVGSGNNIAQSTHTLFLDLADGREVRVQEVSASAVVNRGRSPVHDAVDVLNAELQRRGGAHGPSNVE